MYLIIALLLLTAPALAQKVDPRLVESGIMKLQADLQFEQAVGRALKEDMEAQRKKLCELIPEDKRPEECKSGNKP